MYYRIATTFLANGGIHTMNILGEYSTGLHRDGKVHMLSQGEATTDEEAMAMHDAWASRYQADDEKATA